MQLRTWVDWMGGQSEVARLMGIGKSRVHKWCRGVSLPSAQMMFQIKRLSRGRVSYEDMIETYLTGQVRTAQRSRKKKL